MTKNDLKTGVIYIEDNVWDPVYYIRLHDGNWVVINPDNGIIDIIPEINDDGYEVNPPEERPLMKKDFIKYIFELEFM